MGVIRLISEFIFASCIDLLDHNEINLVIMRSSISVCVTGAAGQIAYALLPLIASGSIFGHEQVKGGDEAHKPQK